MARRKRKPALGKLPALIRSINAGHGLRVKPKMVQRKGARLRRSRERQYGIF